MTSYGWPGEGRAEPIRRAGRERHIGYRLPHPVNGRPLAVLGHYEATSGGCDTIRALDGGLGEAFRLADAWASAGHDVLLEGSALSRASTRARPRWPGGPSCGSRRAWRGPGFRSGASRPHNPDDGAGPTISKTVVARTLSSMPLSRSACR
jgi:hypothetical protein